MPYSYHNEERKQYHMTYECALYAWSENASTSLFLYNIWVYLKNEKTGRKCLALWTVLECLVNYTWKLVAIWSVLKSISSFQKIFWEPLKVMDVRGWRILSFHSGFCSVKRRQSHQKQVCASFFFLQSFRDRGLEESCRFSKSCCSLQIP